MRGTSPLLAEGELKRQATGNMSMLFRVSGLRGGLVGNILDVRIKRVSRQTLCPERQLSRRRAYLPRAGVVRCHGITPTGLSQGRPRGLIAESSAEGPNAVRYYTYTKFKGCEAKAGTGLHVDESDDRWPRQPLCSTMGRGQATSFA